MKYNKGDKLYRYNKTTKQLEETVIVDILYKFNKSVKSKYNYNEEELQQLIQEGYILDDKEAVKKKAIKEIEEQFNIKLKEV